MHFGIIKKIKKLPRENQKFFWKPRGIFLLVNVFFNVFILCLNYLSFVGLYHHNCFYLQNFYV